MDEACFGKGMRARAVLERVAHMSGWRLRQRSDSIGYGIAYSRYKNTGAYCAVVAEIEAGTEIRARRLWIAVDVGSAAPPNTVIDSVNVPARALYGRTLINLNCGFRSLAPGTPKF